MYASRDRCALHPSTRTKHAGTHQVLMPKCRHVPRAGHTLCGAQCKINVVRIPQNFTMVTAERETKPQPRGAAKDHLGLVHICVYHEHTPGALRDRWVSWHRATNTHSAHPVNTSSHMLTSSKALRGWDGGHACEPSTGETEVGGSSPVQGQPELHGETPIKRKRKRKQELVLGRKVSS